MDKKDNRKVSKVSSSCFQGGVDNNQTDLITMPKRPQSPYQHRYGQIPMLYDDPFGRPRFPSTVRHAGERVLYVSSCVDLRRKCTEPLAKIHICRFDATLCTILDTTRFAKPAPPLTTSSMYGWLHATCHYWENVTYFQKKKLSVCTASASS